MLSGCCQIPVSSPGSTNAREPTTKLSRLVYLNFAKNQLFLRSWQESHFQVWDLQQITVIQYNIGYTSKHINHTVDEFTDRMLVVYIGEAVRLF